MPKLIIRETQTGAEATAAIDRGVVTIGRDPTNDIVLEFPEVAGHHCEIDWTQQGFVVRDYDTKAGTYVGKARVRGEALWKPSETLRIGSCQIQIIDDVRPAPAPPRTTSNPRVGAVPPLPVAAPTPFKKQAPEPAKSAAPARPASAVAEQAGTHGQASAGRPISDEVARLDVEAPPPPPPAAPAPKPAEVVDRKIVTYKGKIREYLVDHPEVKRVIHVSPNDAELRDVLKRLIREATQAVGMARPAGVTEAGLEKEMVDEILGLGPLEDLMKDESITEVMVNRWDHILVERAGVGIHKLDRAFLDEDHLIETVRRILAPLGRHLNESSPLVDARLKDGTRINAVIPPVSIGGCVMTIRKFSRQPFTVDKLVQLGSITAPVAEMLKYSVRGRLNVVISGGTGTGKTSFLNALGALVAGSERMVVVEDTHELRFEHPNIVYLEGRPANLEGKGAIPIRRLVINALRMRPDRIIVGECRGDEAFDMLQAMNTGHLGSMTTIHANSPRDALMRIENMVLMAGFELPANAIRRQVISAVNVVVQLSRCGAKGERRVSQVSEITGIEGQTVSMQDIYVMDEEGTLQPTGSVPRFLSKLDQRERARLLRVFGIGEAA